jgi:hypothetical protein
MRLDRTGDQPNEWAQIHDGYWACSRWDVVLCWGAWRVGAPHEKMHDMREFPTAEAAMAWADAYRGP